MEAKDENFNVGDKAVYPGYGVCNIVSVDSKEILGTKQTFYVVEVIDKGTKIMIPKKSAHSAGLRPIISSKEANKVIEILKKNEVKKENYPWNKRYRFYMEKIKSGSVFEIAEVLSDLYLTKCSKELSFGEKRMLESARNMLIKELSLATNKNENEQEKEVQALFN